MNKKAVGIIVSIVIVLLLGAIIFMPSKVSTPAANTSLNENGAASRAESTTSQPSSAAANDPAADTDRTIDIIDFAYQPASLTVKVGDTVTWTNKDSVAHTVTADNKSDNAPDSGNMEQNETYSFTFKEVGTYEYFCVPHPNMRASVNVVE